MIAWAALPQTMKDKFVDPISLWRKTNTADHRGEAVTHERFLEHVKGRTLDEIIHEGDAKARNSASAEGPFIQPLRCEVLRQI